MSFTCPECGAALSEGENCQAVFESFLVLEFTDPGYGEVHMLTVACFMIQHGRYSDEALAWIERMLRASLEEKVPVEQIRRLAARGTAPGSRSWTVTRQAGARPLPKIAWSITIADVAANYRDAGTYCELVREWARTTLREMAPYSGKSR